MPRVEPVISAVRLVRSKRELIPLGFHHGGYMRLFAGTWAPSRGREGSGQQFQQPVQPTFVDGDHGLGAHLRFGVISH